jgi:hypothetical protein
LEKPVQRLSAFLCAGDTIQSQPGRLSGSTKPLERQIPVNDFPTKIDLLKLLMGVETSIPPNMIYAAAPGGAPPRRIKMVEIIYLPIFMAWV